MGFFLKKSQFNPQNSKLKNTYLSAYLLTFKIGNKKMSFAFSFKQLKLTFEIMIFFPST